MIHGFRKNHPCVEPISFVRLVVELSLEWHASLFVPHIEFERVYDSVYHTDPWNAMIGGGVPYQSRWWPAT